jgi:hypothetical protein
MCQGHMNDCCDPPLITKLKNFLYPDHICNFPRSTDKYNSWQVISWSCYLLPPHGFFLSLETVRYPAPQCHGTKATNPQIDFPAGESIPSENRDEEYCFFPMVLTLYSTR